MKKNKTKNMLMILIVSASAASAGISYPPVLMPEGGVAGTKPATRNTYNDPNSRVYTVWEAGSAGNETPPAEPAEPEDPFAWLAETAGVLTQLGTLNGPFTGSLVWAKENLPGGIFIGANARVTGDLYYPGTPAIAFLGPQATSLSGQIIALSGSPTPDGYTVTIAANARITGNIYTRSTPPQIPTVGVPPPATGIVDANITTANAVVPANSRNITVSGPLASTALAPGVYRTLSVSAGTVTLGTAGSEEPTVYALESLTLTGGAKIVLAGPVILRLKNGLTVPSNSVLGNPVHPEWLTLAVSSGGVNALVNSGIHGSILAPSGTVSLTGIFNGGVTANSTIINGLGVNFSLPPPINSIP